MAFHVIIGILGAILVLIAFVSSSFRKLSRGDYIYMLINGSGAFMLVYYAVVSDAIVFAALNAIWGSIEIYYFVEKILKK